MTDQEALCKIIRGESEEAFSVIFQRHAKMVEAVCARILCDSDLAADSAQMVFILLHKKASSLSPRISIAGWLHNAARLVALKQNRILEKRYAKEHEVGTMIYDERESEMENVWRELKPHLDDAISKLPVKLKESLVLCFLNGMTHQQAAENLNCAVNAVSKRISRALPKLRRSLERKGVTVSISVLATILATKPLEASSTLVFSSVKATLARGEIPVAAEIPLNLINGANIIMSIKKISITACIVVLTLTAVIYGFEKFNKSNSSLEPSTPKRLKTRPINLARNTAQKSRLLTGQNQLGSNQNKKNLALKINIKEHKVAKSGNRVPPEFIKKLTESLIRNANNMHKAKTESKRSQIKFSMGQDVLRLLLEAGQKHFKPQKELHLSESAEFYYKLSQMNYVDAANFMIANLASSGEATIQADIMRKNLAGNSWLNQNPDYLQALLDHQDLPPEVAKVITEGQNLYQNPAKSLENLLEETVGFTPKLQEKVLYRLKLWCQTDPKAALDWVKKRLDGELKTQVLLGIMPQLTGENLENAWHLVKKLPAEAQKKAWFEYGRSILSKDPIEALKSLSQSEYQSKDIDYDFMVNLKKAVHAWADQDLASLTEFFQPPEKMRPFDQSVMAELARQYAMKAPEKGLETGKSYVHPEHRKWFFQNFLSELGKTEPLRALGLLDAVECSNQEGASYNILSSWCSRDPMASLRWLANQGDSKHHLRDRLLCQWAKKSFEDVLTYTKANNVEYSDELRAEFARCYLDKGRRQEAVECLKSIVDQKKLEIALFFCSSPIRFKRNRSEMLEFVDEFSDCAVYPKLLLRVANRLRYNSDLTMKTLERFKPGKSDEVEVLTKKFIKFLPNLERKVPAKKFVTWVATLDWTRKTQATKEGFDSLQSQIFEPAFEKWLETEPEQATTWLRATKDLDEVQKQKVAQKLNLDLNG